MSHPPAEVPGRKDKVIYNLKISVQMFSGITHHVDE